jgi:hypothetical protein
VLHVALFMDLNVEVTYVIIVLDYFIEVLDHLQLPHQNTVVLAGFLTQMVQNFPRFFVGKLT